MERYIISEDGTMFPASRAYVVVLTEVEAAKLLDDMSDDERAEYARKNGVGA